MIKPVIKIGKTRQLTTIIQRIGGRLLPPIHIVLEVFKVKILFKVKIAVFALHILSSLRLRHRTTARLDCAFLVRLYMRLQAVGRGESAAALRRLFTRVRFFAAMNAMMRLQVMRGGK